MKHVKNSFCSYCGTPFPFDQAWPRCCQVCQNTSFLNPIPVAVLLVPIASKLFIIKRGIQPHQGEWALPGGFIEGTETWQEAGVRELREETGMHISCDEVKLFQVHSATNGIILIFGHVPSQPESILETFCSSPEALEYKLLDKPTTLAFPLHTQAVQTFFESSFSKK